MSGRIVVLGSIFLQSKASPPTAIIESGIVESIETTIKAVLRHARDIRDEKILLLKLKMPPPTPFGSFETWRAF